MNKTRYNRIKAELAEAGKQSKDLAQYLEVHVTTVSDWCTNTNQPSIQHLYKISEFLQIDVKRLLISTNWNTAALNQETDTQAAYFIKPKPSPKPVNKPGLKKKKAK